MMTWVGLARALQKHLMKQLRTRDEMLSAEKRSGSVMMGAFVPIVRSDPFKIIACLGALLAVAATTNVINRYEYSRAKVTALVVDEGGKPVVGAKVSCSFCEAHDANKVVRSEGLTDREGKFVGEGFCGGVYGASITMDGFYFSGLNAPHFTGIVDGKWQPWNPTAETILRPIGNPVALYAKKVQTDIPVLGQPCGYDLEVGDWVAPYGKGIKSDFILTIQNKTIKDRQNFDLQGELTFGHPRDGICSVPQLAAGKCSIFKWERQARENGYEEKFHLQRTWWASLHQKPVQSWNFGGKEWEGYFFRVRTVEQDGKIVSAHYGKIRGGIELEPRETKTCSIAFTYYFNSTPNARNLEWDTKKNLFTGLKWEESPRDP